MSYIATKNIVLNKNPTFEVIMIKLIKFIIVGSINTLITLAVFYVLNKIFHINYLTSSLFAYVLGMVNSYTLNKKWTFQDRNKKVIIQFIKFIIVNLISLGINLFIMYISVNKFNLDSMLSQIIATGFSTISNYLGSKVLVFSNHNEEKELG